MNTHLVIYDHDNLCIWRESGLRLLFVFLLIVIFTWGLVLRLGYTRLGLKDFGALLCCYVVVLVAGILCYFDVYVRIITTFGGFGMALGALFEF